MNTTAFCLVTITNEINTGSAFAIKHGTGESCFVPSSIMQNTGLRPGDTAEVLLIKNPNEFALDRTPYMVRFVKPESCPARQAKPKPVEPEFDPAEVEAFVRQRMKQGGVWTVGSMYAEYMQDEEAERSQNLPAYNMISNTLRKMFDHDECAKWSMWTKASQSKPGREWFSCYPQRVDVDEWVDTAEEDTAHD
jgi:hypothetical protein